MHHPHVLIKPPLRTVWECTPDFNQSSRTVWVCKAINKHFTKTGNRECYKSEVNVTPQPKFNLQYKKCAQ